MSKEFITIGKADQKKLKSKDYIPVVIADDNLFFEEIKKCGNDYGLITYSSDYDEKNEELVFNLAPQYSRGLKNALPAGGANGRSKKTYQLSHTVYRASAIHKKFLSRRMVPTNDCYFEDHTFHVPVKSKPAIRQKKISVGIDDKQATDAVANELAKQLVLQAGDLIPKLENSIITAINSDAFVSKLANKIMLKQAPQLITNLNRIREQNSASDKQLKEELSKEFASAVDKLIDYWNK